MGVMPSWSITKYPTRDSGVKRLAMPTGDHELAYRTFEGMLPEGSPGAGAVMKWDDGTYVTEIEVSRGTRKEVTYPELADEVATKGLRE